MSAHHKHSRRAILAKSSLVSVGAVLAPVSALGAQPAAKDVAAASQLSPSALAELAAAIGANPNFAAMVANSLATADVALGSARVEYKPAAAGAKGRTLAAKLADIVSVKDFGAKGDGTTDDTAAIQAAIDAVGSQGTVHVPSGTYVVSSTIQITRDRVHLLGAGAWASTLLFAPAADGTCLRLGKTASAVLFQGSVKGLCFFSHDATHNKTAIELVDTSGYVLEDIVVGGTERVGRSMYWSGGASTGIRCRGREACSVHRIYVYADIPIRISPNPNHSISIDHFHFSDCYLSANANPVVLIDSNVNLTQVTFDGYQPWVGGTHGLYWVDTETTRVSNGLALCNIRWEQGETISAYAIYIKHNYQLQGLRVRQTYGGIDRNSFYLRKVSDVLFDSIYHAGAKLVALDVDATVLRIKCICSFWQAGSIANMTGQAFISSSPKSPAGAPLPPNFECDTARNNPHP